MYEWYDKNGEQHITTEPPNSCETCLPVRRVQGEARDHIYSQNDIVLMTIGCKNIDKDETGWFALLKNAGREHLGNGATAWEAVKHAYDLKSLFSPIDEV